MESNVIPAIDGGRARKRLTSRRYRRGNPLAVISARIDSAVLAAVTAAAALEGLSCSTYVNNVLAAYVTKSQREVAE
jgi:predicted DNA binding CopG/RHH family protein